MNYFTQIRFSINSPSLVLLDSPSMLSLHHENSQAGQLQVSWQAKAPKYFEDNMMYMIRYSSKGLGEKLKQVTINF